MNLDFVVAIDLAGQHVIQQLYPEQTEDFVALALPHSASPLAIMIAHETADAESLGARYFKALNTIIKNGSYQRIVQAYYPSHQVPDNWQQQLQRFQRLYYLPPTASSP